MFKFTPMLGITLSLALNACMDEQNFDLTASRTSQPVEIDGDAGKEWDAATPVKIQLNETTYKPSTGYPGIEKTEVELRALYDEENIYILARYEDPTETLVRFPWEKMGDGSWKRLENKDSTHHENHYYEDKFSMFWHINEIGFPKKGCEQSCHTAENGKIDGIEDTSAGRHYTNAPGETTDMWHWKGTRTNPVNQADDQYVNWFRKDQNKEWGRVSDTKTAGGYYDNINESQTAPAWLPPSPQSNGRPLIVEATKRPFVDTFKPGDMVAGMVSVPFEGPRGDIAAKGLWKDGYWTIEMQRKLVTVSEKAAEEDVQFNDLSKTYPLGIAVFDGTQINHLYHQKTVNLTFQ